MALFTYSVLDQKHPYWANLVQKNQNCQFKLKFGTQANSNMQYLFAFFLFQTGSTFFGQIWSKKSNFQFKLKFGTQTNLNMQNSVVLFVFFCFRPETPFFGKFGPKTQNCQFKLKLGTRLIRICRIQWCCSLFLLQTGNTLFEKIWSKKSKLSI